MALLGRKKEAKVSDRHLRDRVAEGERIVRETHRRIRAGQGNSHDYEERARAARDVREGRATLRERHALASLASAAARSPLMSLASRWFSDEIVGTTLNSSRLDADDVKEAKRLLRLDGLAGWDAKSAERLIDLAAGEPGFVKRRRREFAEAEERKREAKRLHLSMLPRRRQPEPGSVEVPRAVWEQLAAGRNDSFDIIDVGLLVAVLFAFANDEPLFSRGRMEHDGRGPAIVVPDAAAGGVGLRGGASGWLDMRVPIERLRVSRWVETERAGGVMRIRPGSRMTRLLAEPRS